MRVYLAGRFSAKLDIAAKAEELKAAGFEITSRWLAEVMNCNAQLTDVSDSYLLQHAIEDVEDVRRADVTVLFTVEPTTATVRGGRHFESGMAYGFGKLLITCGPIENIFHHLPNVKNYATWEDTKIALLRLKFDESRYRDSMQLPTMGAGLAQYK